MVLTRYAFIGDVHSQSHPLRLALQYCSERGITPILLGDIFNSHCQISDSAGVYSLLRSAQENIGAVILRSNHQFYIEELGKKKPENLRKDISRTLFDFSQAGICLREVLEWLESFPYLVALRDSSGREYRAAHAEIPDSIEVPRSYRGIWQFFDPSLEEKKLLLWGKPYDLPNAVRFWWLSHQKRDWIAVAGHYHRVFAKNKSLVLDAGCGGETRSWYDRRPPELLLYDVEERRIVSFPVLLG